MNKLIKVILFLIVGMVQAFAWGGLRGDTLAKELDEAVLNRSFYLQQREQRITQLKDMFLLSKISLWQEYEIKRLTTLLVRSCIAMKNQRILSRMQREEPRQLNGLTRYLKMEKRDRIIRSLFFKRNRIYSFQ